MGQPKTINFYRCPRPMQDRFVAATRRSTPPAPLLFHGAPRTGAWVLLALSAVLVVAATVVLVQGYGDVASPLALHGKRMLYVDVLFFTAAAYCFVHAAVLLRALEALPYRAGTYVFPACVVEASGGVLRVWPVKDVEAVERLAEPALALKMRDGQRVVVRASKADVERADAALQTLRPELARALAAEDVDMLAELDPLYHTRVSSPISSTESLKPFSPLWSRFDWVLAVIIGVALGFGLVKLRDRSSDERMYRTVVAEASVPRYQEYLRRGGQHSDEVRDVLLARAELNEAQRQGTLEALQEFVRTHPTAKIGDEVDAAMRRALLVELDKAKAVGTVAALSEFARKFPDSHLETEIRAAKHALYSQALEAWKKKSQADAQTAAFFERLLGTLEKTGPVCEVRFRLRPSKTLDEMDKKIAKHAYFPGPDALPSHYLTAEAMHAREQRVAQSVVDGFSSQFPADLLEMHAGEPLAADAAVPPGAPTLVVDDTAEWSNAMTANDKPRTVFAGVRFDFDGRFVLPDGPPLVLSLKSWRGPELWKIKNRGGALDEFEGKVYAMMIDHAFDEWQKKLADTFFQ